MVGACTTELEVYVCTQHMYSTKSLNRIMPQSHDGTLISLQYRKSVPSREDSI